MRTVFDTNFLLALLAVGSEFKLNALAGSSEIEKCPQRVLTLIDHIEQQKGVIVIPAPALSEVLVKIEPRLHMAMLERLSGNRVFEIVPFDQLAAIECALLVNASERKQLDGDASKAKVSFDRQIISIAKARSVKSIHTQDKRLAKKAKEVGIEPICLSKYSPKMEVVSLFEAD